MNNILKFLSDNYIYVTGIGLILIIILIGFLANRRKDDKDEKTEEKEKMVNINDVQTGAINQVAENLNRNTEVVNTPTNDALVVEKEPVVPVMNEVKTEKPNDERLEKTEVMDFSEINGNNGVTNPSNVVSFTPEASQYDNGNMLNGEETTNPANDQNKPI